jgi:hypothetical protein
MSQQTRNNAALKQILQAKNVSQFTNYMTNNATKSITPASASLQIETYITGGVAYIANANSLTNIMKAAGSSSLDTTEIIGLYDVRLNPQLYKKYQLNYALSTGSTFNEAVMWADNNS